MLTRMTDDEWAIVLKERRRGSNRLRPLLRQSRVVDNEDGVRSADQFVGLVCKRALRRGPVPDSVRYER